MKSDAEKTIKTLKEINEFPFYTATYYGNYKLGEFKQGAIDSPLAAVPFFEDLFKKMGAPIALSFTTPPALQSGCSAFYCRTGEESNLLGKNLDWKKDPILLLRTRPNDGYNSLTMVNLNFCDLFNIGSLKYKLLLSPYVPLDGINENGLVVTMLSVHEGAEYPFMPNKISVGDFNIIRIILDSCKDVDEALEYFGGYNLRQTGMLPLHYLIADRQKSCIVEFAYGEINIKESSELNYLTNFIKLKNPDYENKKKSCQRYQKIEKELLKNKKILDIPTAQKLLKDVSVFQPHFEIPTTIWSIIYDINQLKMIIRIGKEAKQYTVTLVSS